METKERLKEERDKIVMELEEAYRKLVEFKKKSKKTVRRLFR
jgi:hypothetical protein